MIFKLLSLCWIRCKMEQLYIQHGGLSSLYWTWRYTYSMRQMWLNVTMQCCHCCWFWWSCWSGESDSLLCSVIQPLVLYLPRRDDACNKKNLNLLCLSPFAPRFLLENFYLDEHVRYIVTIYPVVILWFSGSLSNSDSPQSRSYIFAGTVWDQTPVFSPFSVSDS